MKKAILIVCVLFSFSGFSQKKSILKTINYGFNYGVGHEDNFLFNDTDYSYDVHFYKIQLYYPLKKGNYFSYELLVQPEINKAQHQLHNLYFVTPDEVNFIKKRDLFTQKRTFNEYVLNVGFIVKKAIFERMNSYLLISVGPSYIDIETERLAKGFAFSDNLALGLNYTIWKNFTIDFRTVIRHISNAELQKPNGGYNTLNFETGFVFKR